MSETRQEQTQEQTRQQRQPRPQQSAGEVELISACDPQDEPPVTPPTSPWADDDRQPPDRNMDATKTLFGSAFPEFFTAQTLDSDASFDAMQGPGHGSYMQKDTVYMSEALTGGIFDDDAVLRLDPNLNSDPQPDVFASAAVFWNTGRGAATFERFTRFIDKAQVVKCSSWPVAWLRRRVLRGSP